MSDFTGFFRVAWVNWAARPVYTKRSGAARDVDICREAQRVGDEWDFEWNIK